MNNQLNSESMVWSVSDFVAVFNQTIEYAYPSVVISGEITNFRISKNKWVYFDLKDDFSSLKFFGSVYSLPGPLEDGMTVQVVGVPKLHNLYGFSISFSLIQPVGEGSIKKAQDLLKLKLEKEGLFDESRKRLLPYPPTKIGLITSSESAAHHDFVKIINQRWSGLEIELVDVQVQGDPAVEQIVEAISKLNFNTQIEVIIITRGGGSSDDLAVFSNEKVVRAVASSRTPTMVAIGHEIDYSLAELVADKRASTPSNAAELLVPDKEHEMQIVNNQLNNIKMSVLGTIETELKETKNQLIRMSEGLEKIINSSKEKLQYDKRVISALNPNLLLSKGYVILRKEGKVVKSTNEVRVGDELKAILIDGELDLVSLPKGVR